MATKTKYVPVRKKDFLKAVVDNFSGKSQIYLIHLVNALMYLVDNTGNNEPVHRVIEDMDSKLKIWLPEDDLL